MVRLCGAAVTRSVAQDTRTRPRRGSRPTMRAAATRSERLEHGLLPAQWALWRGNESLATWAPAGTRSPPAALPGQMLQELLQLRAFPLASASRRDLGTPSSNSSAGGTSPPCPGECWVIMACPERFYPRARLRCVLSLLLPAPARPRLRAFFPAASFCLSHKSSTAPP